MTKLCEAVKASLLMTLYYVQTNICLAWTNKVKSVKAFDFPFWVQELQLCSCVRVFILLYYVPEIDLINLLISLKCIIDTCFIPKIVYHYNDFMHMVIQKMTLSLLCKVHANTCTHTHTLIHWWRRDECMKGLMSCSATLQLLSHSRRR